MNYVKSPLTGSSKIELLNSYSVKILKQRYLGAFKIDISNILKGIENIYKYKCLDSGYVFYYPFNIAGDSFFYEQLERFDWYYMPWKWEHQKSLDFIDKEMKVLEIGCAEGQFLSKVSEMKNAQCVGLELNVDAVKIAVSKGLNVCLDSVEDFSLKNEEKFDIVCSFQVLEHISDVKSFTESMFRCLKKGGKLIIGVPNNDSFLGNIDSILNQPPHHLGLWNETSLLYLGKLLNVLKTEFFYEPPQSYHKEDLLKTSFNLKIKMMDENIEKYGFMGRIINLYYKSFFNKIMKYKKPTFENFTVLVVYTK